MSAPDLRDDRKATTRCRRFWHKLVLRYNEWHEWLFWTGVFLCACWMMTILALAIVRFILFQTGEINTFMAIIAMAPGIGLMWAFNTLQTGLDKQDTF